MPTDVANKGIPTGRNGHLQLVRQLLPRGAEMKILMARNSITTAGMLLRLSRHSAAAVIVAPEVLGQTPSMLAPPRRRFNILPCGVVLVAALVAARPCLAQSVSQAIRSTGSTSQRVHSTVHQESSDRKRGWQAFGSNLLHTQKKIWLFPVRVAEGHHVKAALTVVGVTAALVGLDPLTAHNLTGPGRVDSFNRVFSGENTYLGTTAVLPAFYLAGLLGRNDYAQHTALLATAALLEADTVSLVMEDVTRRALPGQVSIHGDISDTWFRSWQGQSYLNGAGGFPSGHTIAAFAVATVIADRYPHPSWHRWVAYGMAGLVAMSRLSTHSHFPSDTFLGAALGYAISRYVIAPLRTSRR